MRGKLLLLAGMALLCCASPSPVAAAPPVAYEPTVNTASPEVVATVYPASRYTIPYAVEVNWTNDMLKRCWAPAEQWAVPGNQVLLFVPKQAVDVDLVLDPAPAPQLVVPRTVGKPTPKVAAPPEHRQQHK